MLPIRNMCRTFVKNAVQIPKEKFATTQMCSGCGCFWSESEFKMKLKSQHVRMKGKTKRLIEKLNKSKEPGQKSLLSGKQRIRAKWLQKRVTQRLEIMCDQCHHKSIIKMEKPKRRKQKKPADADADDGVMNVNQLEDEEVVAIEDETKVKVKKKKKNKNKSAGLKLPLDVQVNKQENQIISKPKTPQKTTLAPLSATQKTPKQEQHIKQSAKEKKQKKKSTTASTPTTAASSHGSNKGVSKTKQQNSLLQLAALLKQNSSSDSKNATQKRLESLLK